MTHFNLFSSGSVEIIFQSTANFYFFMNCYVVKRYSHHVEDTGRPFSWISLFFHFLSQYHVLYFWIRLSCGQSWHDKRNFKTHIDDHGQFISQPAIWQLTAHMQKNKTKKTNTTNKMLQSSFTILAYVFLTISGRFCVKLIYSTCQNHPPVRRLSARARGFWLRRRPPYWNQRPTPTLLWKRWWVRFMARFTFPIVGMYILNNI